MEEIETKIAFQKQTIKKRIIRPITITPNCTITTNGRLHYAHVGCK